MRMHNRPCLDSVGWSRVMTTLLGGLVFAWPVWAAPPASALPNEPSVDVSTRTESRADERSAPANPDARLRESEDPVSSTPPLSTADTESLWFLRDAEMRLALGERLSDAHVQRIYDMTGANWGGRVRQKALTLLPWFPGDDAVQILARTVDDPSPALRVEAVAALALLVPRGSERTLTAAHGIARHKIWDASDDVACRAARILRIFEKSLPDQMASPTQQRLQEISDTRYACFVAAFALAPRGSSLPESGAAPTRSSAKTASESEVFPALTPARVPQDVGRFRGDGMANAMVYAAAMSAGGVVGALAPALWFPPEERLAYSPVRTRFRRQEPSLLLAASAAIGGAALAGAGIWALQSQQAEMTPGQGMAVVLGTSAGSVGGLGAALAMGWGDSDAAWAITGGTLIGLTSSLASQYYLSPSWQDSLSTALLAAQVGLFGSLTSLALVPPTASGVLGATRIDFAVGTGMFLGSMTTTLSQWLVPLLRPDPSRLWAAGLASSVGAAAGIWLGGLPWTRAMGTQVQWNVAVGAGLQLVSGVVAYSFLPISWARWLSPGALRLQPTPDGAQAARSQAPVPTMRWSGTAVRPAVFFDFVDFRF